MRGPFFHWLSYAVINGWTILQSSAIPPPISVSIQATWPEPPLLIQILESVAIEKPATFFPLLTAISLSYTKGRPELGTHRELYEETLKQINSSGLLSDHGDIESLEMSIALKEASPKIEAFRTWYDTLDSQNIKSTQPDSTKCESWADFHGLYFCDASQLRAYLLPANDPAFRQTDFRSRSAPRILPFDHISPSASSTTGAAVPVIILYASDDPHSFGPFHNVLYEASQDSPPRAVYVFRWQVSSQHPLTNSVSPSFLGGWAAGLNIKKSDYLTIDDRPVESNPKNSTDPITESEQDTTQHLSTDVSSRLTPLKAGDVSKVGLKATQHIMASPKPIHALRILSEDFPKHAHALVNDWVPGELDADLESELLENVAQGSLRPGQSGIWMNGLDISFAFPLANVNMFKLIQLMRQERRWMNSLMKIGLKPFEIRTLVADEDLNSALTGSGGTRSGGLEIDPSILGERFDASDRQERAPTILWLNDLEKDDRYSSWPSSLRDFLRPTFPGQLHAVARNSITVILALDLGHASNIRLLAEVIEPFITRSLPIRWGLIPLDGPVALENADAGKETILYNMWRLFESRGPTDTLEFVKQVIISASTDLIDAEEFKRKADAYLAAHHTSETIKSELKTLTYESFKVWHERLQSYIKRLALRSGTSADPGSMFINGKVFPIDNNLRMNLQQTAMLHIQFLQHQIYYGLLRGDTDVSQYMYDLPGVYPARNEFVFPSASRPMKFVNLLPAFEAARLGSCGVLFETNAHLKNGVESLPMSVIWILGDLDSKSGAASVMASLEFLASPLSSNLGVVRFGFVHSSTQPAQSHGDRLSDSLARLIKSSEDSNISAQSLISHFAGLGLQPSSSFPDSFSLRKMSPKWSQCDVQHEDVWAGGQSFIEELGVPVGGLAVVINGRVLDVLPGQVLQASDYQMLIEYENQKRTIPLQLALAKVLGPDGFSAAESKVPLIASAIGSVLVPSDEETSEVNTGQGRTNSYSSRKGDFSSVSLGNRDSSMFEFGVVLDPASELAQSWSALLENLSSRSDVSIKVWFNPLQDVEELPIKRFFRTSVANRIQFDEQGSVVSPSVIFEHMPTDVLLTLSIETPPAWLALPLESVHDLDNIMLSALGPAQRERGVEAIFQLEHIIIAGHAKELPNETPPRGLQIVLTNVLMPYSVDTIIMANLGYFQFKASPGIFALTIRPGRSSELYSLERMDTKMGRFSQVDGGSGEGVADQFSLTTFDGLLLFPRFRKRIGKEEEMLIQPVAASPDSSTSDLDATEINKLVGQIKNIAAGILGGRPSDSASPKEQNVINVFTVASGLLYERMAYLMCVSVMRHTQSRVKFWFISNFLSPSFKRFIPHLARQYKFDYQLVTYRWPPWLRAQKEKQRIIWGYKILFLDVLFPLELDRVIFVDSDQIVRTDLQELVNLDLRGAPYAYAPMCNDREETKGFRFWDTGYWKESLQGRPYHISALYVVDLRVFRAIAAGDQLRQHYQTLSADPGSLANLDQDLPNNMQTVLPIFTLDQNWLWCETWCSDAGLKTAKTIDLCNNPLTHEPKLTRARRLIPEWDVYDQEVAKLAQQVKDSEKEEVFSTSFSEQPQPVGSQIHSKDEL
ncbi:hypothetical protein CROQUDRAFT_666643 [Cronartium quercuum f. sp. fusiforme G11]|uniref:UDP-glucose:glycoprotein glucosyltransferase n=1 Tax=Cronartium quercuum f. sp. fusiforme G11 TaxID=708437 RepID=A0A9P6N600_9BASI|nr:hypothetical protein CROQUDRAFT_666643 [Cronartium quercuum f. sp. fusiforme G11]